MSWNIDSVSGLVLWLDAQASVTHSGGYASAWPDQSTTSATVSQATGDKQPAYDADGWLYKLPCLIFDGDDDSLSVTGLSSASTSMTLFVVYDQENLMYAGFDYLLDIETGRCIFAAGCDYDGLVGYYTNAWHSTYGILGKQILTFIVGSDGYYIRRNGKLIFSYASGGNSAIGGNIAVGSHNSGTGSYFKGSMAEVALYTAALSDADVEKIEGHLAHKWLIGDMLAYDHTYTSARMPIGDWESSGGPAYQALIDSIASGYERREAVQDNVYRRFNVRFDTQTLEEMQELLAFFMAHKGRGYSFRYKDWDDYSATGETCSGSGTSWQLQKAYTSGTLTYTRTILKPVYGTVTLYDDGSEVDSADYEIDYQTGVITLDSAATGTITADFEFDCCCRLDTDDLSQSLQEYDYGSTVSLPLVEVPA